MRLTAVLVAASFLPHAAAADSPPAGQRVFVSGHSFHMPIVNPLAQIAAAAGVAGHKVAGTQSIGGSTVSQHWDRADAANKAKQAITAGGVDVLTLSPHLLLPDPAIDKFAALLLEHCPTGRVTVQASWYPMDGPQNLSLTKRFANADRDAADPAALRKVWAPVGEKIREQVAAINGRHAAKAGRPVAFVVPTGDAVLRLRERVVKGEVPGVEKQSALFTDPLGHGTAVVGVLNAYCHFAVIYGKCPVGLPAPDALKNARLGENADKVNRVLQEAAWGAVCAEPLSGVKEAGGK